MKRLQLLTCIILFQLNIFAQFTPDTTKSINTWKLNSESWGIVSVNIDTGLSLFHQVNPFQKNYFSYSTTGNLGGALINNIYRDRADVNDFYFIEPYYYQLNTGDEFLFYNTKNPYTDFRYSFNPGEKAKDEQIIDVLHTQNIKPWFNVGIDFRFIGSKGQYAVNSTKREWPQRTRNGTGTIFSSYNGLRYNFHGRASFSNFNINQHGGIRVDSLITQNTEEVLVNLYDANAHYKSLNVSLLNTYDFRRNPRKDSVIHKPLFKVTGIQSLNVNFYRRIYTDDFSKEFSHNPDFNFYNNILYDSTYTKDSLGYRQIENEIGVRLRIGRSDTSSFYAYFNYLFELQDYRMSTDSSSVSWTNLNGSTFYNQGIKYGAEGNIWGFYATFYGRNYFAGYKLGDTYWKGKFGKEAKIFNTTFDLGLKYSLALREPGYLYRGFESNHFSYSNANSFKKEKILDYGVELINKDLNMLLGAYQTVVGGHVYFDSAAMPAQYDKTIIIQTVYWKQALRLWKFHLNNNFAFQLSNNNDLLAIPKLNYYGEFYFDHTFNFKFTGGKLWFNLGLDAFVTDEYYAYKFSPAGEQFYLQGAQRELLGLYPYINPFIRAKVKRLRVFVMYEHVNSDMFEPKYFTLVDYPINKRILKLGISWLFYD